MPLDPIRVALAMDGGLSAVCSTCQLYWEARDRGVPGDGCLAKERCGSPISGDTFHEYVGPLAAVLDRYCFVCGERSSHGVKVKDRLGVIGVCADHVELVRRLHAQGKEHAAEQKVLLGPDGNPVKAPTAPKKSLAAAIHEAETYFAKKGE